MAAMLIKQLMCFNKQQIISILMVEKKPFCVKDPPPSFLIFEDYLVFASYRLLQSTDTPSIQNRKYTKEKGVSLSTKGPLFLFLWYIRSGMKDKRM